MPLGVAVAETAAVMVAATVTISLIGRLSKISRMAVGQLSGKISQMKTRSRSTSRPGAGAACVRARRKKEVVIRWINFIMLVGKN
jgi:hypothetical protein